MSRAMNRAQEISDSIPNDLLLEIFSRLPAKSVGRFRCVSKQWGSMLRHQYFTELFLTRSQARPRLLFALNRDKEWSFFSTPQLQNPYGNSVSVEATFHMKFSQLRCIPTTLPCLISGLIYFSRVESSPKESDDGAPVIFNPTSRQYVSFPERIGFDSFIGFDPIDKQHKVLVTGRGGNHRVLTLGTGETMWRKIQCPLFHRPLDSDRGICINGVLYYFADTYDENDKRYDVIVCFDVRSEKFSFIDGKSYGDRDFKWINYKGKLGVIECVIKFSFAELRLWVLEDVEKQEWSNYVYPLPRDDIYKAVDRDNVSVVGMTATGEIVLSNICVSSKRLNVFYFNPERNTFQSVGIKGIGEYYYEKPFHRVYAFVDVVDDLHVNDAKYLKSSQSLNIIRETPKLIIWERATKLANRPINPPKLRNFAPFLKNKYNLLSRRGTGDVEKQEWSKYVYTLPPDDILNVDRQNVSVVGMTATEYYHENIYVFVDVVEDVHVNDAKYLKSSQGLNIIREMPKPIIWERPQKLCNSAPLLKNKYDLLADLE
ncbi:unnamed protein product [Microthlaspi erraticum]|uniref:F-box domain-containing protein n=1 Tax=Microthlaspi erraticum TaxID=1685480 RepID=A0A6D2L6E5_9BRAS|nr:unnamed protein product [Microthlaspi erraticum]